jgi:CRISPR-associated protein Csb2
MTRHLCISVTLLDPLFHGQGDAEEPEWPPSPMRLFQAMLAGSRCGCRNGRWSQATAEAFRWLERHSQQSPPWIIAPVARRGAGYTLFVPNNDADKKFDRQERLTSKVVRPQRLAVGEDDGGQPTLHYLWGISEAEWPTARPHAQLVCREARNLMALGWGIDQAVGDGRILTSAEASALAGRRWRPWRYHRPCHRLSRIPKGGSLDLLQQVHESFLNRVEGRQFNPPRKLGPSGFDTVEYLRAELMPPRAYAVFELPEGVAFRQEDTSVVAAMLRSLACDAAKQDTHQFPGGSETYVAGHLNGAKRTPPRFSYLPLPTIGHEHADGMIRRLLIAEPYDGDGSHARWAQQRLRNRSIRDHDGNERRVLMDLWRTTSPEMLKRYVDESQTWSTVTPVILPGFDDGKHLKAEKLFRQAITQAWLPFEAVAEITLRKAPFWPGSNHPRQYRRPAYLKDYPAWHVHLRLREPIAGPLALGAGRHCGLGLFAAEKA